MPRALSAVIDVIWESPGPRTIRLALRSEFEILTFRSKILFQISEHKSLIFPNKKFRHQTEIFGSGNSTQYSVIVLATVRFRRISNIAFPVI